MAGERTVVADLVTRFRGDASQLKSEFRQVEQVLTKYNRLVRQASGKRIVDSANRVTNAIKRQSAALKRGEAAWMAYNRNAAGSAETASRRISTSVSGASTKVAASAKNIEKSAKGILDSFRGVGFILISSAVEKISTAFDTLADNMQRVQVAEPYFDNLTKSAGLLGDVLLNETRKATEGMIADLEIMENANRALLLGVDLTEKEFASLARAALILGRANQQTASKSLEDLTVALGRQSTKILDNLGVVVSAEEAQKRYAESLGVAVEKLDDNQRRVAWNEEAIRKLNDATERAGGLTLTFADRLDQVGVSLKNVADGAAAIIAPIATVLSFVTGILSTVVFAGGLGLAGSGQRTLLDWIKSLGRTIANTTKRVVNLGNLLRALPGATVVTGWVGLYIEAFGALRRSANAAREEVAMLNREFQTPETAGAARLGLTVKRAGLASLEAQGLGGSAQAISLSYEIAALEAVLGNLPEVLGDAEDAVIDWDRELIRARESLAANTLIFDEAMLRATQRFDASVARNTQFGRLFRQPPGAGAGLFSDYTGTGRVAEGALAARSERLAESRIANQERWNNALEHADIIIRNNNKSRGEELSKSEQFNRGITLTTSGLYNLNQVFGGTSQALTRFIAILNTIQAVKGVVDVVKSLIPGLHQGGYARPGLALVGEKGPEVVDFSRPGRVYSNEQLSGALGSGREALVVNFSPIINGGDEEGVRRAIRESTPMFLNAVKQELDRPHSTLRRAAMRR